MVADDNVTSSSSSWRRKKRAGGGAGPPPAKELKKGSKTAMSREEESDVVPTKPGDEPPKKASSSSPSTSGSGESSSSSKPKPGAASSEAPAPPSLLQSVPRMPFLEERGPSDKEDDKKDSGGSDPNKDEIMSKISNDLKEMVEQERGKLVKLRGELLGIPNPLGYQKFREEEAVKEEIIDALQAIYEAKSFSDKRSLEAVLTTLQDDYEETGKEIVSKALSRRRARAKAISAIEKELRRERRRHTRKQVKLVVLVAGFTYLVNKMHRDKRFRARVGEGLRAVYSVWKLKVAPGCGAALRWLNQRRKAFQRALGPQGALPSRNSSRTQLGESKPRVRNDSAVSLPVAPGPAEERDGKGKKAAAHGTHQGGRSPEGKCEPSRDQAASVEEKQPPKSPENLEKFLDTCLAEAEEDNPELFFDAFAKGEEARRKNTVPAAFFCPITQDLMTNPVIAADGHTYEREAIKRWLKEHKTSPRTNLELHHTHVIPNHSLKSAISEFKSSGETQ